MKRFLHIDFLRAVAILAVIVIHVFSDNLTSRLNFYIWNYLHVIIVAFVFSSGYVLYAHYASKITNWPGALMWYKKRLFRLLVPFYWYLLLHYALLLAFPRFFSGLGLTFSWSFLLQSVTLTGGISLNWLPLLFLQLAVIFPPLVLLLRKQKKIFWLFVGFAILTTIAGSVWQFPYSEYRSVMWIPWSLIFLASWYFYTKESSFANATDDKQKKQSIFPYFSISIASFIVFIFLYVLWQHLGRSLTLIDNKYPPNMFYISYETAGSFLLLGIGLLPFFQRHWTRLYLFVSRNSYGLFFIHYIVMDFMLSINHLSGGRISVWVQTDFVLSVSVGIAYVLSYSQKYLQAHSPFLTAAS